MKKALIAATVLITAYIVYQVISGGFDVKSHHYSSFKEVKGGWLPISADLLPEASKIDMNNNLDTNEYFFKTSFSEDNFKKVEAFLQESASDERELNCSKGGSFCEASANPLKIKIYRLEKNLEEGHSISFWALDSSSFDIYLSNQDPPSPNLVIAN